jgi:hypothetical protein
MYAPMSCLRRINEECELLPCAWAGVPGFDEPGRDVG